jgi:hypothetical protein
MGISGASPHASSHEALNPFRMLHPAMTLAIAGQADMWVADG